MAFIEMRVPQPFTDPDGLIGIPDTLTGLLVSLDADSITGTTGTAITGWESTAGTLPIDFETATTGTTMPTLATGPNGHKAVAFDGTQGLSHIGQIMDTGQTGTMVVVARRRQVTGTVARIVAGHASTYDTIQAQYYGTGYRAYSSVSGNTQSIPAPVGAPALGDWGIYLFTWSGATARLHTNFAAPVDGGFVPGALTEMHLGSSRSGADTLVGDIARVALYDRALTDVDAAAVVSDLAKTYGL